jgi:nonsense-mediated mRNA decay protein 3
MERVCPKCGARSSSKKFFGDFCEDCFLATIDIELPRRIELPACRACGKVRISKWDVLNKTNLKSIVKRNAKGNYDSFHVYLLGGKNYEVVFLVSNGPNCFEVRKEFSLVMNNSLCEDCSRATSGYYEAIIQVRGNNAKRWAEKIIRELKNRTFVSKYKELDEGIDIYVGSRKEASAALSILKRKPSISDKLYGVKDGRRIYRRTYCIRV